MYSIYVESMKSHQKNNSNPRRKKKDNKGMKHALYFHRTSIMFLWNPNTELMKLDHKKAMELA